MAISDRKIKLVEKLCGLLLPSATRVQADGKHELVIRAEGQKEVGWICLEDEPIKNLKSYIAELQRRKVAK